MLPASPKLRAFLRKVMQRLNVSADLLIPNHVFLTFTLLTPISPFLFAQRTNPLELFSQSRQPSAFKDNEVPFTWVWISSMEGLPHPPLSMATFLLVCPQRMLSTWKLKAESQHSWSFQSHPNMFQFRFIQNFENQSPRERQGRCIHMYDLINVEAEIPCIQKALSQRWLLAGIDFFVLLRWLVWPYRCSRKGHIYSRTDLLAVGNTAQTSVFPDEVANS